MDLSECGVSEDDGICPATEAVGVKGPGLIGPIFRGLTHGWLERGGEGERDRGRGREREGQRKGGREGRDDEYINNMKAYNTNCKTSKFYDNLVGQQHVLM